MTSFSYENFCRSQDVIFEMMNDRCYLIDDVDKLSKGEFLSYVENGEDFFLDFESEFDDATTLRVVYHVSEGIDADDLKKLFKMLNSDNIKNCLLIKYGKSTPVASATLSSTKDFNIQLFDINETLNNITKHTYVPPHTLLLNEEAEDLLQKYGVVRRQIPRILSNEPIVKYHNWAKGSIIKIVRKNGDITFRCVW